MYETVTINSFTHAIDLFFEGSYNPSIHRIRSDHVFRGVRNSENKLQTSLYRNCHSKPELVTCILRNFAKYAENDYPELTKSIWRHKRLY